MSDPIKHECGIVLIRLLKPLSYYQEKYGTPLYGINLLHLLMQKQRNRGQDGAGIATVKIGMEPGQPYINRKRSNAQQPLRDIFDKVYLPFDTLEEDKKRDTKWLKANIPFMGELLLGHLRYGTHGTNDIETVHPFLRENNWINRNLVLAGNFNLTNVDELFEELLNLGQFPRRKSDTVTVLEKIGHFLDDEVQRLYTWYRPDGYSKMEISTLINDNLDLQRLLRRSSKKFDGGYVMGGLIGHGDAFVMRDPAGIRPAYYYTDDEVVVCCSERPPIQTALDVNYKLVKELEPGHALIIKRDGKVAELPFIDPQPRAACSFERIYFSRGTDREIYLERKKLGQQLTKRVLEAVGFDLEHTVFSFVPNTAETAFLGLIQGIEQQLNEIKKERILEMGKDIKPKKLEKILAMTPRVEKLVVKDEKLRTFITDDSARHELVSHVYDVTYGIVQDGVDTLVLLDDSIVRGTTLRESLIRIVSRLRPKKIVFLSSAPQIRFPDCYGIDMSKMKDFVAFQALVKLLQETGQTHLMDEAYQRCKAQENLPVDQICNQVASLYALFPYEMVTEKIAEIVTPEGIVPKVEVIYQTIEGLHAACPNHQGDWYFSGNYPTPGGNRVVNRAFMNFMENRDERAY
ncbi:MAG: amidophosphoribosyltransferase [Saprospirales bacterium]|nr:amidophosphoribosyltransferase [Saprospirales bacterium]